VNLRHPAVHEGAAAVRRRRRRVVPAVAAAGEVPLPQVVAMEKLVLVWDAYFTHSLSIFNVPLVAKALAFTTGIEVEVAVIGAPSVVVGPFPMTPLLVLIRPVTLTICPIEMTTLLDVKMLMSRFPFAMIGSSTSADPSTLTSPSA
jgi:hypothetical protein